MITITRSLARDLRAVFRRVVASRQVRSGVEFAAGRDGLTVRYTTPEVAVAFRRPGRLPDAHLFVSPEALADCEGRDSTPVTLATTPRGRIEVTWTHAGGAGRREYPAAARASPLPAPPPRLSSIAAGFLTALDAASQVATIKILAGPTRICCSSCEGSTPSRQRKSW